MLGRNKKQAGRWLVLVLSGLTALAGGCQWDRTPDPDPSGPPITLDPAMQRREWETSHAYFANGNVEAGTTRFPYTYRTTAGQGYGEYSPTVLDPLAFIYQAFRVPFTYFRARPFAARTYTGVEFDDTFTAAPPEPLPGSTDVAVGTGMSMPQRGYRIGTKGAAPR
jgi:hypothetical protein